MKRDLYRPKYCKRSILFLKRNDSPVFEKSCCKKIIPSVYIIGRTCFDECFLLHVITGRYYSLFQPLIFFSLFLMLVQKFVGKAKQSNESERDKEKCWK